MEENYQKLNKYDIIEVVWINSHSSSGWSSPSKVGDFIGNAKNLFCIKTIGYFFHQDKNYLRVCQGHDNQGGQVNRVDDNLTGLYAVAKPCIVSVKNITSP